MGWLVRNGEVLATAEIADTPRARRRGLRGRTHLDGVLVIRPCRQVHTFGMRMTIDVAFVDAGGVVRRTVTIPPRRISRVCAGSYLVLEARSGAFARWGLRTGDRIEIKE